MYRFRSSIYHPQRVHTVSSRSTSCRLVSLSVSPVNAAASAALPLVLGSQGCATKCALADTALQCPFTVVRFVCRRQAVGVNRCTSSQQRDSIVMQQDSVGMYFYATDPGPSRRTTTRSSRILLIVSTNAMSIERAASRLQ